MNEFIRKLPKRCNNSNYIPETGIWELPYRVITFMPTEDKYIPDIRNNIIDNHKSLQTRNSLRGSLLTVISIPMSGTIIGQKNGRYNNQRSYGLKDKKDLLGLGDFCAL